MFKDTDMTPGFVAPEPRMPCPGVAFVARTTVRGRRWVDDLELSGRIATVASAFLSIKSDGNTVMVADRAGWCGAISRSLKKAKSKNQSVSASALYGFQSGTPLHVINLSPESPNYTPTQ